MKSLIKEQINRIEELKERIKEIESEDHYYQLWLKEREELIKKAKENNLLLDKIDNLSKKLTIEIKKSILEGTIHKKILDKDFNYNWLKINPIHSRHIEIIGEIASNRFNELDKKLSRNIISELEMIEYLAIQQVLVSNVSNNDLSIIIPDNPNQVIEFKKTK